jgi:hypothetical protein
VLQQAVIGRWQPTNRIMACAAGDVTACYRRDELAHVDRLVIEPARQAAVAVVIADHVPSALYPLAR